MQFWNFHFHLFQTHGHNVHTYRNIFQLLDPHTHIYIFPFTIYTPNVPADFITHKKKHEYMYLEIKRNPFTFITWSNHMTCLLWIFIDVRVRVHFEHHRSCLGVNLNIGKRQEGISKCWTNHKKVQNYYACSMFLRWSLLKRFSIKNLP